MNKTSFYEILKEKMMTPHNEETERTSSTYDILEHISPIFRVDLKAQKTVSSKQYPVAPVIKKTLPKPQTPNLNKEIFIYKKDLNSDEISIWNLFEKTVEKTFAEKISRSQAISAFRHFAKKVHPDTAKINTECNFAFIVKVKNEMLQCLDRKIKQHKSISDNPTINPDKQI